MARAPFNVLVLPYRFLGRGIEYAIFNRSDSDEDFWQGITGGGEDTETPAETAIRETWEESSISKDSDFMRLDSVFSIPVYFFSDNHLWRKDKYVIPMYSFGVNAADQTITISHEHIEFRWVPFEDATKLLKFENNTYALWELDQRLKDAGR